LSPLDIGTDIAGSIRVPCHFCGVAGLRTTDGWLPIDDIAPEGSPAGFVRLVTLGPIARDVPDLELLLDAWASALPYAERPLADGPLAVTWALDGLTADERTRNAMRDWLEGREVVEVSPDLDFAELFAVWGLIAGFEFSRGLPWYARNPLFRWLWGRFMVQSRLGQGPLSTHFRRGLLASQREYEAALATQALAQSTMDDFLGRYQAWVLPVCPGSAPLLALEGKTIDGESYTRWHGTFNCPTAVLGTPALSVPLPVEGMPIGVQIHGRRFSDRALVRRFSDVLAPHMRQTSPAPYPA
jgi:amidase